jgi:hypothetical protein
MTNAIVQIAGAGIAVHDRITVGKNGHASLRGLKLIQPAATPPIRAIARTVFFRAIVRPVSRPSKADIMKENRT